MELRGDRARHLRHQPRHNGRYCQAQGDAYNRTNNAERGRLEEQQLGNLLTRRPQRAEDCQGAAALADAHQKRIEDHECPSHQ